jgi:uncharacterized protein (DUF2062 family)
MSGFQLSKFAAPTLNRVREFLRQGMTPEKLVLCLALGICLSCCPILGITTTLCALAALSLRLNLAAIQLANYAAAPLQLVLLLPFIRLGERIFHTEKLPLSIREITTRFHSAPWATVKALWTWEWHAVVAWLFVAVPCVLVLKLLLKAILMRVNFGSAATAPAEG